MDESSLEKNYDGFRIFVDEPKLGETVFSFPNYISTISDIIESSKPRYTVGIFGEWGTGKTTLMDNIRNGLKDEYNCLYFNAWRYEGEKRNATYPLMLSILEKLSNTNAVRLGFKDKKNGETETLGQKFFRVLNAINATGTLGIPGGSVDISLDRDKLKKKYKNMTMDDLNVFYKQVKSPLVEGIEIIRDNLIPMINDVVGKNKDLKLIVFVDDLDRCTPEKAAQVLESIKVFFDISGIVFVLGLSKEIVEASIDVKYDEFKDLKIFSGSDYIKKIIQVPFVIPTWTKDDLKEYLNALIDNHEDATFKAFFKNNSDIISDAVEKNPREVKRLLNNFLLARKIFDDDAKKEAGEDDDSENLFDIKLLLIQALSSRWRWFYDDIFRKVNIVSDIKGVLTNYFDDGRRMNEETTVPGKEKSAPKKSKFFMENDEEDPTLISFLIKHCEPILEMPSAEWKKFRRTVEIDITIDSDKKQKESNIDSVLRSLNDELYDFSPQLKRLVADWKITLDQKPRRGKNKEAWNELATRQENSVSAKVKQIYNVISELERFDEKRAREWRNKFLHILEEGPILNNMSDSVLKNIYTAFRNFK